MHAPDPFAATRLLIGDPGIRNVVLSLASLFPAELQFIETLRRHRPDISIDITDATQRGAALARAGRLGADRMLTENGQFPLRKLPGVAASHPPVSETSSDPSQAAEAGDSALFLSPAELRALLGP